MAPLAVAADAVSVSRSPDSIHVVTESGTLEMPSGSGDTVTLEKDGVRVATAKMPDGLHVRLAAPQAAVRSVQLHWTGNIDPSVRCLGDTWERAYGDLAWKPLDPPGRCPGTSSPPPVIAPMDTA